MCATLSSSTLQGKVNSRRDTVLVEGSFIKGHVKGGGKGTRTGKSGAEEQGREGKEKEREISVQSTFK